LSGGADAVILRSEFRKTLRRSLLSLKRSSKETLSICANLFVMAGIFTPAPST
jgi:hypothetical protein